MTASIAKGRNTPRLLVIGVGNEFRSDDGVGLRIARELTSLLPPDTKIIQGSGEGASLIESWNGFDIVIIIDAVKSGALPGRIHRIDASARTVPVNFFNYSSHAFSVAEAIEVSRALGSLPSALIIYGIEGKSFSNGTELTPEVLQSAGEVKKLILDEIKTLTAKVAVTK
ncbi:MAG: hydrogenase maturation protease [Candidatus Zixiibacteriota bacterium]